jgi:hypothetical protein
MQESQCTGKRSLVRMKLTSSACEGGYITKLMITLRR